MIRNQPYDETLTGRFDTAVAELREADVGSQLDLILRYSIVTITGLVLFYATGTPLVIYWLGAYLGVNTLYSVALYRMRAPIHLPRYVGILAGNMMSSGLFLALPLFLFTLEDQPALRALAIAAMSGHALFNLSRHTARSPLAYWDIATITTYVAFVTIFEISRNDVLAEQIVLFIGGLAVGSYYITAQLGAIATHERLQQAQEAAVHDQKIRAVGRLTGGVAHDFNNLLTVIKGNLELYSEVKTDSERAEVIEEAQLAADRASAVIAQLLSFSRQSLLVPTELHLEEWAEEFRTLAFRLLPVTIHPTLLLRTDVEALHVDAGQLTAAMMNLVINARDAMKARGGALVVEIYSVKGSFRTVGGPLRDKKYVCLSVRDTGTGVAYDALSRLTEPFYTTKEPGQGSGLGLSMARGFAEQSGGGLSVASTPGKGTTVSLYIALDQE